MSASLSTSLVVLVHQSRRRFTSLARAQLHAHAMEAYVHVLSELDGGNSGACSCVPLRRDAVIRVDGVSCSRATMQGCHRISCGSTSALAPPAFSSALERPADLACSPSSLACRGPWFSTQLILSLTVGLGSFLIFCWLRRKEGCKVLYAPRTMLKGADRFLSLFRLTVADLFVAAVQVSRHTRCMTTSRSSAGSCRRCGRPSSSYCSS